MKLSGDDLIQIGFSEGRALGLALEVMDQHFSHLENSQKIRLLEKVISNPREFISEPFLSPVANELLRMEAGPRPLNVSALPYTIYGA
ncbi:MAG TPA: hypothetical protein VGD31_09070, partial [Sphingobacteriaceae bacterium]